MKREAMALSFDQLQGFWATRHTVFILQLYGTYMNVLMPSACVTVSQHVKLRIVIGHQCQA